jgi:two-component system, NarL family, invasion response regulator UvrY
VARDDGDQTVRVLIVEDDPRVRTALRRFLSASDDVEVVGDAGGRESALRLAMDLVPAVALVDVHLPDAADGLELLHALTDLGVPVVAISIHGSVRGSALAAGADQFLDKDSAPDLMVAALRRAAQRRTQLDRP